MKPKQVTLYETTSGETVKTLEEWKVKEVRLLCIPDTGVGQGGNLNALRGKA